MSGLRMSHRLQPFVVTNRTTNEVKLCFRGENAGAGCPLWLEDGE